MKKKQLADQILLEEQLKKAIEKANGNEIKKCLEKNITILDSISTQRIENEGIINLFIPYILDWFKGKLAKFKVDSSQYEKLLKFHYTIEETKRITFRRSSSSTIETVLKLHEQLLSSGLKHEEIAQIAAHGGSSKNLAAYLQHKPELLSAGFSRENLIKVVANRGGAKNLETLLNYVNQLKAEASEKNIPLAERLTSEIRQDLIKILAHDGGGSKNLEAYLKHEPELLNAEFSSADLIKITANKGGSKNLETLLNYVNQLKAEASEKNTPLSERLTSEIRQDLIKILAHDGGGSKNLEAYLKHEPELLNAEFSSADLIKITANKGGSKNLETLLNYVNQLKAEASEKNTPLSERLTSEMRQDLIKILARDSGSKNLKAYLKHEPELLSADFNRADLIKIAANKGGSKNLEALVKKQTLIKQTGLHQDERIYKMLQRPIGYRRLDCFIKYYPFFYLYKDKVEELLSVCCVSKFLKENELHSILSLNALLCYFSTLKNDDSSLIRRIEPSLLDSIVKTTNEIFKDKGLRLELKKDKANYSIKSPTHFEIPVRQIEEKLKQFNLNSSLQLQQLLAPKNASYYRLLRNPNGNQAVYYLDTRPWKAIFPVRNLQNTIAGLLKKGILRDTPLECQGDLIQQIIPVEQHFLSVPVGIIETIRDNYFGLPRYELILSHVIPSDSEIKPDCIYLYRKEITLEALVKRDNKLETVIFSKLSFTIEQYGELLRAFDSSPPVSQLQQSTLYTLSQLCFEIGHGCYLLAKNQGEIFEFMDDSAAFYSLRKNCFVQVTHEKRITPRFDYAFPDATITYLTPSLTPNLIPEGIEPKQCNYLAMPPILGFVSNPTTPKRKNKFVKPETKQPKFNLTAGASRTRLQQMQPFFPLDNRINEEGHKEKKNSVSKMDNLERIVRVFNEVNEVINESGWKQPTTNDETPTVQKQVESIINLYVKTGRLIIDGYCKDNIVKEKGSGGTYDPDPRLMVKRNSVSSEEYWYADSEEAKKNKGTHHQKMYERIEKHRQEKQTERALPIFCILGLNFYDALLWNKDRDHHALAQFTCDSVLTLGISIYTLVCLKKGKLNTLKNSNLSADKCLDVLRGKLKFSLKELKKYYAEGSVENLVGILAPLFLFRPPLTKHNASFFKSNKRKSNFEENEYAQNKSFTY